jgi:tetratricopeptide (TPR) repeat protein
MMKIPLSFYIGYWFKNSLMALATGYIIAFLIPPIAAVIPYYGPIVLLSYQVVIYRHFWGKRRGDFEFSSQESLLKKRENSLIRKFLGMGELVRFKLDRLNNIVTYGWDIYKKLLEHSNNKNKSNSFCLNHIAADLSRKEGDIKKERNYLLNAVASNPDDLISNFRLAVTFEREGRPEESIKYYRRALAASSNSSFELKEFINRQITRVKEKGPKKIPPVPGLRFMSW